MPGPEAKIERSTGEKALNELGVMNTKLGQNGDPDRLFWIPGGRPLLIEFKAPGEDLKPHQRNRIKHLEKLGYDVEVHDNVDTALNSIKLRLEIFHFNQHASRRG